MCGVCYCACCWSSSAVRSSAFAHRICQCKRASVHILKQLCYLALLSATLTQAYGSMYMPVILISDDSACDEQVSKSSEP